MNYVPGAPGALVNQSAEPPTVSNITPPLQLQPTLQAAPIQQVRIKFHSEGKNFFYRDRFTGGIQ